MLLLWSNVMFEVYEAVRRNVMFDLSSRCVCVCLCFNFTGLKAGYHGINGQISQIPGLSPVVNSVGEEKARGRRGGVLDSDSDYVKLAKQGGHKGRTILLLCTYSYPSGWIMPFACIYFCLFVFILVQQDSCGTRSHLPLNGVHTNLQTGSAPHQKTAPYRGTVTVDVH